MTYLHKQNSIFNFIFETSISATVKDAPAPTGQQSKITYTLDKAKNRYKEITGSDDYTFNTYVDDNQYIFNNYAPGGYFLDINATYEKTLKIRRDLTLYKGFFNELKNDINNQPEISNNTITIQLNPRIIRTGLNFNNEKKRATVKNTIDNILNKSLENKQNFKLIVQSMAYILYREKGVNQSSDELIQREHSLICWSILNQASVKGWGSGGSILKVIQSDYTNPEQTVGDLQKMTSVLASPQKNIKRNILNNFEIFVMAFFDGYINPDIDGVKNWSHVNGLSAFSPFHLPKSIKNQLDPDAFTIGNSLSYKDKNKAAKLYTITKDNQGYFKIPSTSNGETYTLDGNVIFTL